MQRGLVAGVDRMNGDLRLPTLMKVLPCAPGRCFALVLALLLMTCAIAAAGSPQAGGNATSLVGTVVDETGAVILGATVKIHNPVSGFDRSVITDAAGQFSFTNVPFNPYHLTVTVKGFSTFVQDVELRSVLPTTLSITMRAVVAATTVTVHEEAGDLVETDSTSHTDVERNQLDRLPENPSSAGVSAAVTALTPGVSADSNNQMHGLGDHASNTIAVDDQANSDQTSKTFSNQIPSSSIQSMEVIAGAPPAEFGGKTSLVVKVNTRSGLGQKTPNGSITTSYGSFGTENTAFDRVDYQIRTGNSIHVNVQWTRSWFQTPNTYDNLNLGVVDTFGDPVPAADQRSQIKTINVAPSWSYLINPRTVFTLGTFVRRDDYHYYPSNDPFADLGPANLQRETVGQQRTLTNAGVHSDIAYVRGINNMKFGATYEQTFLNEADTLGIVDPTLVPGLTPYCLGPTGQPIPGTPCATLAPYDLTGGGGLYAPGSVFGFNGSTDIKELALYVQDTITA